MLSLTGWIFCTLSSSMRVDGSFFSVAMTTPFVAAHGIRGDTSHTKQRVINHPLHPHGLICGAVCDCGGGTGAHSGGARLRPKPDSPYLASPRVKEGIVVAHGQFDTF